MTAWLGSARKGWQGEEGVALTEYTFILALVFLAGVLSLTLLGGVIANFFGSFVSAAFG